ncbi:hypothetical protein AB0F52_26085 [Amycolatopsis sp. NPDC024027]|uniref:hypothetical protein n=1 Tax=Amycolatopsis sp. NPDC024027 TaxID=3154327 RepID=UPI0033CBD55D
MPRPRQAGGVADRRRPLGIGAGIARQPAQAGWDVAFTYWTPYDARMAWGIESDAADSIAETLAAQGSKTVASRRTSPTRRFRSASSTKSNDVSAASPHW